MCNSGGSRETWRWCRHSRQWGDSKGGVSALGKFLSLWTSLLREVHAVQNSSHTFQDLALGYEAPFLTSSGPSAKYFIIKKKKKPTFFPLFLWTNNCHHAIANVDIFYSTFSRSLEENKSSHCYYSFLYASRNIFTMYSIHYPSSRGLDSKSRYVETFCNIIRMSWIQPQFLGCTEMHQINTDQTQLE